jgi:DNA-directed RNA polymerase subunit RPC12/RpoP
MSRYEDSSPYKQMADERYKEGRMLLREGNIEEARKLLTRAVELDQEHSDAWLWLSATTKDPEEQKKYLEWALAANPGNPEARRGLAILQGRLKASDVLPQGTQVEARKPVEPEEAQPAKLFDCPQCGGVMRYDTESTDLKCERCGHIIVVEEKPAKDVEQVLDITLPTEKGQRWAEAQRRMVCQQCSATTIFPIGQTSSDCPFCGSAVMVAAREDDVILPPQAIIPMGFEEADAKKKFRKWLGSGFFAPDDLGKQVRSGGLRPAYIPFWVFEATVNGKWQAQVAEGYGDNKQWLARTGEHTFFFSNELVPGTKQLARDLLAKTEPFDMNYLVEYKPEYLAGWPAATYDVSLSAASLDARERMTNKAKKQLVYKAAPGQDIRDLQVYAADFGGVTYKQVLLPVWVSSYAYRGKNYRILINGQSGKVAGDKPTDSVKVAIIVLMTIVALVILSFVIVIFFGPYFGLG